jgi:hypothetical protein
MNGDSFWSQVAAAVLFVLLVAIWLLSLPHGF